MLIFFEHLSLKACKVKDLGEVNMEDEMEARRGSVYIPNWFSPEIKTGVSQ